jgi:hypothetical protein
MIRELATLTGESQTTAIRESVRERLDRVRHALGESLADRLISIGKDCASRLKEPFRSEDHSTLLYNDTELP